MSYLNFEPQTPHCKTEMKYLPAGVEAKITNNLYEVL